MTPEEAVASVFSLYSRTVSHLSESGWDAPPSDASVLGIPPQVCSLRDGKAGVKYSTVGLGPGHPDATSSAGNVAAFWKSIGLTTDLTKSANEKNDRITTDGASSALTAQYTVNGDRSSLSIVTSCVPGNADELTEGVQKHRDEQSATPTPTPTPTP
ncbi:hypothetical protein GCM10025780_33930 [Frondihabitans cladoniiphilus]|uniref:LppA-like lipoprotein n=1 Tax=Frondihabitans cladoniiphilus TaxID=715785 RepID=A0ABP8W9D7_9MICO